MKKLLSVTVPLFLSLLIFSTSTASTSGKSTIDLGEILLEKIEYKNKDYAWYVARLPVRNLTGESGTVSVKLNSIDKHAYQRGSVRMSGHIEAGEHATLTLLSYMDYKLFDDIRRWEIEKIELH